MQTGQHTVGKLFKMDKRHVVPLFQRPYVWTRELQWEPLWEDIQSVADRLLEGYDPSPHFIGALVLDLYPKRTGFLECRLVIDGQQRMTTIQLFLEAFADYCEALVDQGNQAFVSYTKAMRKLTRNDDVFDEDVDGRYKVWPTNSDQATFRAVMEAGSPEALRESIKSGQSEVKNTRISDAYLFFHAAISGWIKEKPDLFEAVDALFKTINDYVRVVVIDLESEDDAQVIFETLNARGTPLLPADLVKNDLLHRAQAEHLDIEALYARYWSAFDDNDQFWRAEIGRGHAKRARIDTFFQHYLAMRTRDDVATAHLYADYRRYAKSSAWTTSEHLADLCRYGDIYRSFDSLDRTTREGAFLGRLRVMEYNTAYPFLLALFGREGIALPERHRVLDDIESFLVRRLVCHLSTRGYNRLFIDLVEAVNEAEDVPHAVREFLLSREGEAGRWPDDDEFGAAWVSLRTYGWIRQDRVRMVLEALERRMRSDKSEKLEFGETLTIEHLMPQKWGQHYSLPEDVDPVQAKMERERIIHTFGNLTLLTRALNPAVSNGPWLGYDGKSGKRDEILAHSALALNRVFQNVAVWDEAAIAQRGEELLEVAKKQWARP